MLMLDATLVSTDQPSLEQRGDEVDARHDFVRRVGAVAEDRDLMLVTGRRQSGITSPAVGVNHRPALHSALDEGKQTVCRDISDLLKADAAKQVPARPDHGAAQLVQPGPGSFVAAKPQFPLEAERTDPILLAGDKPHRQKPHPQRLTGTLEDRPGGQRCLFAAGPTPQPSPCHQPWLPRLSAMGAGESLRPAQTTDVLAAGRVVTEAFVHRLKRAWVIKSSDRVSSGVHQTGVPRPSGAVKGIPSFSLCRFRCSSLRSSAADPAIIRLQPTSGNFRLPRKALSRRHRLSGAAHSIVHEIEVHQTLPNVRWKASVRSGGADCSTPKSLRTNASSQLSPDL